MIGSQFLQERFIAVQPLPLNEVNLFNLGGLNMFPPDEQLEINFSPFARNFRLYAPDDPEKRVAISKRKGHARYSVPVGETLDTAVTSVTGASDQPIGLIAWKAQKYIATANGRFTKLELKLKNSNSGTRPLIVRLYSNSAGNPGTLLANTSITSSDIAGTSDYVACYFMEAPEVTAGTIYWIVGYIQEDGSNTYEWATTTSATTALASANSGNTWTTTNYAFNYKAYVSTDGEVLGQTRFYRSVSDPQTVFAFGTNVYKVNDITGAVTSIKSGLNAAVDLYTFVSVNDYLYWVNGLDSPKKYNGITTTDAGGSPVIASMIALHRAANRLFYLQPGTNYVQYTEAGDYEAIGAENFLYVPATKTSDPVIGMVFYQNTMVFLTRNNKYNLYGTDTASFELREAPAKKGAVSPSGIVSDKSYIFFVADDGVYQYNGGTEKKISEAINPLFKNIADITKVSLHIHNQKLLMEYRTSGQGRNNNVLVYDMQFEQWCHDTSLYISHSISLNSQTDDNDLVRGSSLVGALYYGNTGGSDLGRGIEFEYRTKYLSFGHPSTKHRLKRTYVHIDGADTPHSVTFKVDADRQDSPVLNEQVDTFTALHVLGEVGLVLGMAGLVLGNSAVEPERFSVPGAARSHQFRFSQYGVDNEVGVLGVTGFVETRNPV